MAVVTFKHVTYFLFVSICVNVGLYFCNLYYLYKVNIYQISKPALHNVLYEFPPDLAMEYKYNWTYTGQFHKHYSRFAPALNSTERRWYIRLIRAFVQRCEDFNITFMLCGGTVLGVYMYHGFIPWDDDFDVYVLHSHQRRLQSAFKTSHTHILGRYANFQWKVWNRNESIKTPRRWNWPYIDIFFFKTATHFYDFTYGDQRWFFPKGDMFPLQVGLFENMFVPVPNNMTAYLQREYGFDVLEKRQCGQFEHKNEKWRKSPLSILNSMLFHVYPRVYRHQSNGCSYEELRLGHTVLYKIKLPIHYKNTSVQIYWKFYKTENFQKTKQKKKKKKKKNSDIFHVSAQNIDCEYSLG